MITNVLHHLEISPEEEYQRDTKTLFGFWIYIMSDCILFASIFATYAILRTSTYGGASSHELFSMPFVLVETIVLLTSSFTYGLVTLYAHQKNSTIKVGVWLATTFLLGVVFLGMELKEFSTLIHEGNGPDRSAFLSAFFTLVGTHGLHVFVGLVWMVNLFFQVIKKGVTTLIMRKLSMLGLFWHFLDIIWIFIFTLVYLFGVI